MKMMMKTKIGKYMYQMNKKLNMKMNMKINMKMNMKINIIKIYKLY